MFSYKSKKTSPKKHYSRWRFYGHPMMPAKYLHRGYHIVIPSTDCGDLEVLVKNLEVDTDRILAADFNPDACEKAREYGVEATCGDILAVLELALKEGKKIHTLNLDFCESPISTADALAIALRANVEWVMYTFSQRSGKNLPTAAARRAYIIEKTGHTPFEEWDYSSDTKDRKGSAMTCMIFRGSGYQPYSLYPSVEVEDVSAEVEARIEERTREMVAAIMPKHSFASKMDFYAAIKKRLNALALRTGNRRGHQGQLAVEFGVSQGRISQILMGNHAY
jgi:hypothetical protein